MAQVRGRPQIAEQLARLPDADRFGGRDFGVAVTDRRTSWVRRHLSDLGEIYVKTYDYVGWRDRIRGLGRTTGPLVKSRASREFDALSWLLAHAPPAAEALAVFEARAFGLLRRAILVTAAFPGPSLAALLPQEPDRAGLAAALGRYVGRLHRLGFRDGNLDLRNLLARRDPAGGWEIVKIDSPRYRLIGAGNAVTDTAATRDWQRLLPQLEPYGLAAAVRRAADDSTLR